MLKYTKKNMKFTKDTKHTSTENKSGNFWGGFTVTLKIVRRTMVTTEDRNCKRKEKLLLSGREGRAGVLAAFLVNLAQAGVIRVKGTSPEKMLPSAGLWASLQWVFLIND